MSWFHPNYPSKIQMLNIPFYYIFICILYVYVYVYISGHLGCRHQQVAANTWDQNWGSLWFSVFSHVETGISWLVAPWLPHWWGIWIPIAPNGSLPNNRRVYPFSGWWLSHPSNNMLVSQYARQWESSAQIWLRINVHETTTSQLVSLISSWVLLDKLGTGGHIESDFRMDPRETQHL